MSKYAKSIMAALVAALTSLGTAMTDDTVTGVEWIAVAIAFLAAGGVVWGVPNTPKSPADPNGKLAAVAATGTPS